MAATHARSTRRAEPAAVVRALLDRHGQTFAEEIGADAAKADAAAMFQLFVFALLSSTRIKASLATRACRALFDAGWRTPAEMAAASWEERTRVLNENGYARYDESTSRRLEQDSRRLLDSYDGDLNRLRDAAGRDPAAEKRLLREFDGIGAVGADIFLREAQAGWDELVPYVDDRARSAAREVGLPSDPAELAGLVRRQDVPRLVAALVRTRLDHDAEDVVGAASAAGRG